jgi:hypothetical protein
MDVVAVCHPPLQFDGVGCTDNMEAVVSSRHHCGARDALGCCEQLDANHKVSEGYDGYLEEWQRCRAKKLVLYTSYPTALVLRC